MKICVISTTVMNVPPPGYSGLEMLAWQQADQFRRQGHEVLLVAPNGSTPPPGVELHGTTLGESEIQAYSGYWQKLAQFDAICDHSWQKCSTLLKIEGKLKAPILLWLHAPVETMMSSPPPIPKPCFVAISRDQAGAVAGHLGLQAKVCYNGVDPSFYKPAGPVGDRYLFLARMSKLKGPHIAAAAAKVTNVALDLVGDDKLVEDPNYVNLIMSMCNGQSIVYRGGKPREECVAYFSAAKAMLHCNSVFREPFGLAPIEAQMCGCPVIASDFGAMRETVNHGVTGFLYRTFDELKEYILTDAVSKIDRKKCREWALQFSIEQFGKRSEELVKEAIATGGW